MHDPHSPGTNDPNTGWIVDQASGHRPPSGVAPHGHSTSDLPATSSTPVGIISAYWGTVAPSGWLVCDGGSFSAATYPALAVLLGGTTLPNLKGKVIVGYNAAETEFDAMGETGGSKTSTAPHTHDMKSHTHAMATHDHSLSSHTHDIEMHNHYGATGAAGDHSHSPTGAGSGDWAIRYAGATYGHVATPVEPTTFTSMASAGSHNGHGSTSTIEHTGGFFGGGPFGPSTANAGGAQNIGTAQGPSDNTSNASSAGATSGNLQPYMALSYIIKAA